MCQRRAQVIAGVRLAHRGHGVEALAHRAVAVRVHVRIQARGREPQQRGVELRLGEIRRRAEIVARQPLGFFGRAGILEVRLQQEARKRGRGINTVEVQFRGVDAQRRLHRQRSLVELALL